MSRSNSAEHSQYAAERVIAWHRTSGRRELRLADTKRPSQRTIPVTFSPHPRGIGPPTIEPPHDNDVKAWVFARSTRNRRTDIVDLGNDLPLPFRRVIAHGADLHHSAGHAWRLWPGVPRGRVLSLAKNLFGENFRTLGRFAIDRLRQEA
jgi:hypothetical protein